jgi:chloramphenicol 3-O-phosphotransferase
LNGLVHLRCAQDQSTDLKVNTRPDTIHELAHRILLGADKRLGVECAQDQSTDLKVNTRPDTIHELAHRILLGADKRLGVEVGSIIK